MRRHLSCNPQAYYAHNRLDNISFVQGDNLLHIPRARLLNSCNLGTMAKSPAQ